MKNMILNSIAVMSIATCALSTHAAPITGVERVKLAAQADDSLLALRAGTRAETLPIGSTERASLQYAQAADPGLLEMRAAGLSEEGWTILAIVLGVILLIIIL